MQVCERGWGAEGEKLVRQVGNSLDATLLAFLPAFQGFQNKAASELPGMHGKNIDYWAVPQSY